jgi:hypothetical protein
MSAASCATPCQRSATAASLQSFSTRMGQENRWRSCIDRPSHSNRDLPQVGRRKAGLIQAVGNGLVQRRQTFIRIGLWRDLAADGLDDFAVQVGEQCKDLVGADIDSEHVSCARVELVAARRTPYDGPIWFNHSDPAPGRQFLDDDTDGGP